MSRHRTNVSAFLVYRPVLDYEESLTPYFVCATKEEADIAAARMNAFLTRVSKRFPSIDHSLEAGEWCRLNDQRTQRLNKVRWPFGIDLRDDMCDYGFHNVVQVMTLPWKKVA